MNQELTTEQKARVFAQHIGQRVCTPGRSYHPSYNGMDKDGKAIISPSCLADCHEGTFSYDDFKLLLRPLSTITDEDAVEVAKMYYGADTIYQTDTLIQDGKRFVMRSSWCDNGNDWFFFQLFQFLIQRGYAVPLWHSVDHPLNGKTAIEIGLAIEAK